MTLEDILGKKDRILIIESLSFDSVLAEQERIRIAKELSAIYEKPITIELVTCNALNESTFSDRDNYLVIFNSQSEEDILPNPFKLVERRRDADKLKLLSPNAEYIIFSNLGKIDQKGPLREALELILRTIDYEDDDFIDHIRGDRLRLSQKETVLQYLNNQVGQIRHSIGGKKDTAFIKELSQRYLDGNNQTSTDKTFLIVSNRLNGLAGKFNVVSQECDFKEIDFEGYAAIFVDNNYSFKDREDKDNHSKLGSGIAVLERLSQLNVRVPIIYQTAHSLEDLTDEDIRKVHAFENVLLMPKNRAFKICKLHQAKKEIEIAQIVSNDHLLSNYGVRVSLIGEKGYIEHAGNAIIATNAVQDDADKLDPDTSITARFNLNEDLYSHRLAVLAAFHSRMKSELTNPVFGKTVEYLRPWTTIEESLAASEIKIEERDQKRALYTQLKEKHEAELPTTIIHNDPKWDNWFNSYVLGDFSDCAPGTEYKDIARTLLDKETDFLMVCDQLWVDSHIKSYLSARKQLDAEFEPADDFETKVKELIFIESLRLARFKSQTRGDDKQRKIVTELLSVADYYQEVLCTSYKTIPISGESAP